MTPSRRLVLCAASLALACAGGCSQGAEPGLSPLAQKGRKTYLSVCIACHNGDPNEDGVVGPAIAGSPEKLVAAKVLHGTYPPGYTPKRPGSTIMPTFPYLADDVPALAAYLREVREAAGPPAAASAAAAPVPE